MIRHAVAGAALALVLSGLVRALGDEGPADAEGAFEARQTSAASRQAVPEGAERAPTEPAVEPAGARPARAPRQAPPQIAATTLDPAALGADLQPDAQALSALEQATQAGSGEALLKLATRERSLVRYEALRRGLGLLGVAGLERLGPLWAQEDPRLHALLGEASGAGGGPRLARTLSRHLEGTPSRRLAAATAILTIERRAALHPSLTRRAERALEGLLGDTAWAGPACWALRGAARSRALRQAAENSSLSDAIRVGAAEGLLELNPEAGRDLLRHLARALRGEGAAYAQALLKARD